MVASYSEGNSDWIHGKDFSPSRAAKTWKGLPREAVQSLSLETGRIQQDKAWKTLSNVEVTLTSSSRKLNQMSPTGPLQPKLFDVSGIIQCNLLFPWLDPSQQILIVQLPLTSEMSLCLKAMLVFSLLYICLLLLATIFFYPLQNYLVACS